MAKVNLKFLNVAIRDYKVGAITRTSKYVIAKILSYIKPEYKYFVEYGSGDGVVTKEILKIMPEDGRLIGIELNPHFFNELKKIKDRRLTILNGDISELSKELNNLGLPRIDFVFSNVPFTIIPLKVRNEIVKSTYEAMAKGGTFLMFQYSLLMKSIIKKVFKNVAVYLELRNLPPYFIMTAIKNN